MKKLTCINMEEKAQRLSLASRSRAPVTREQKPIACHMRAQPSTYASVKAFGIFICIW